MKNINITVGLNIPKTPYLNQATPQKNTCTNFPTQNNLKIENFNP